MSKELMEWGAIVAADMGRFTCSRHGDIRDEVMVLVDQGSSRTLCKACVRDMLSLLPDVQGGKS